MVDRHCPACHHCGLPVPSPGFREEALAFCCQGCVAAYRLIRGAGLDEFYRRREFSQPGTPPRMVTPSALAAFDREDYSLVRKVNHEREVFLLIEGIHCAACIWLNEQVLRGVPGVRLVTVNFATHRARVRWDPTVTSLSILIQAIHRLGYRALPYDPDDVEHRHRRRDRSLLRHLGVAGFGAANIMLIAVALYAGYFQGMEERLKHYFHWVSMLLATPTVFYGGWTFFRGAWNGLRQGRLTMDLPIALGALATYGYSVAVTLYGRGEVYFDSVAMFIFILMTGRYLESAARRQAAGATERLLNLAPRTACVLREGTWLTVPTRELVVGDQVLVRPGEQFPADGEVLTGTTSADESMVTGESQPVSRQPGDPVVGSTFNLDGVVTVRLTRVGEETVLAHIIRLVEAAQNQKPAIQRLADRIASRFVAVILTLAILTFLFWWWQDPAQAVVNTVALLIITCPCALGLAIPAAVIVATGTAARAGILIKDGEVLERLVQVTQVVLDKTGTVTLGQPRLEGLFPAPGITPSHLLTLAAAVERYSEHPAARAILRAAGESGPPTDDWPLAWQNHPGFGVAARLDDRPLWVGQPDWVADQAGLARPPLPSLLAGQPWTLVGCADSQRWLGWLALADQPRPDASLAVSRLVALGCKVMLLSGDHQETTRCIALQVGIADAVGGVWPGGKEAVIRTLQRDGAVVAMVGDGINDGPALASAEVAIAVHNAADISVAAADVVILNHHLTSIPLILDLARRTLRVVRQSLVFSAGYNAIMIPLAAAGWVAPIVAAVAMPLSSLAVIANALRLRR